MVVIVNSRSEVATYFNFLLCSFSSFFVRFTNNAKQRDERRAGERTNQWASNGVSIRMRLHKLTTRLYLKLYQFKRISRPQTTLYSLHSQTDSFIIPKNLITDLDLRKHVLCYVRFQHYFHLSRTKSDFRMPQHFSPHAKQRHFADSCRFLRCCQPI